MSSTYDPCYVCLTFVALSESVLSECCGGKTCKECLRYHIEEKVTQGIVQIICPFENCDGVLSETVIKEISDEEIWKKYVKFKVDRDPNSSVKTCPNCAMVFRKQPLKEQDQQNVCATKSKKKEKKEQISKDCKIVCEECKFVWCFDCHAPWHYGISCEKFCKGDTSLRIWARNRGALTRNATQCPKCRVYIQRISGCDSMACSRCQTQFCYRCGRHFRGNRFLGDHHDALSVFGCKYKYKPDNPTQRKAARGALLSAKVLALPFVAGAAAGAGCVVLGLGIFIVPAYVSYKVIKKRKNAK